MNMRVLGMALVFAVGALPGCAGQQASQAPVKCRTAVQYTGYEFSISGLGILNEKYKLGSAVWKTTALQQAQAITQALDVMQFGDCQLAEVFGPNDSNRLEYLKHRDEVIQALTTALAAFKDANTPEQATKALSDGQAAANSLAASSPKPSGSPTTSGDSTAPTAPK